MLSLPGAIVGLRTSARAADAHSAAGMLVAFCVPLTTRRPNHNLDLPRFVKQLGPGLITGAADDDPSGIATYSVTGASFGYGLLWTALLSFPMMAAVQLMCARLARVTGKGLAAVIRGRYSRGVLWTACLLLVVANVFNIGADLAGMGEVTAMLTGHNSLLFTPVYMAIIVVLLFWGSYRTIAGIFKWLTLVLFAYVATAFLAKPDWAAAVRGTLVPHMHWSAAYLSVLVGVFGTTISPYLFFWQAAEEVEEERALKKAVPNGRKAPLRERLRQTRTDVLTGMSFSNVVMYFIILTTAATLHAHGVTQIASAREAAEALRPLAGNYAYWLFAIGVIGTGMLAVPVLAGSSAFAISEAMRWRASLDRPPRLAREFYLVLGAALALGLGLDYARIDVVKMLFWSAVLNGVLAPPLVALVVSLTSDTQVMGPHANSRTMRWLGWLTAGVMTFAAGALLITEWL